jgi:2-polyprenyl-3-methyl-5-hydroxy-6-metoxy-1,4-benzoquinol methylase
MSTFQRNHIPNVSDRATEEVRACPYCGNETADLWTYGRDRLHHITDATFPYFKCRICDVIFLARRPCQNEIGAFYPVEYAPYGQSPPQKFRSQRRRVFERVLNGVARSLLHFETQAKSEVGKYYDGKVKEGELFLDFGCGGSEWLDRMRKKGMHTIGVDFSPIPLEGIKAKGHQGLLVEPGFWKSIRDESVSFVRMNHVLEHLYDPRDVLGHLYKKLYRGGVLHVAVPNPSAWLARAFRSNWLGLDCPRHLVLYPPTVLKGLLMEIGFGELEIIHEPAAKDHIRTWALFLNDKGLTHVDDVNSLIHNRWLQALFAIPAACAVLARGGDRFHVIAKKK